MRKNTYRKIALIILITCFASATALAQAGHGRGRLNGVVLDKNEKPLADVKIKMEFEGESNLVFEAVTNKKGQWGIVGLGTGNWMITVIAKGYIPVSMPYYIRQLERNPSVTIKLEKEVTGGGIIQDETSFTDLEQGNAFFKEGKYDSALAMYEEFLKKNPSAYQVYLNIGDCHREKGEYEKAAEAYNLVIEKAKEDKAIGSDMTAKALAAIGLSWLKQDNLERAQEYFKQSIEVSPQDELLAYNVAEIYFSNQKIDEAQKYYEMAIEIKPDWSEPYLKLAYVFLNKGDMANAAEYLEKFLKLEPEGEKAAQAKGILDSIKK